MPFFLRRIQKGRWFKQEWLQADEVPGDALNDLATNGNRLSVYYVEDVSDETILKRIYAAIAATRDYPDNLDYALIDARDLDKLGLRTEVEIGLTPDDEVNLLHRDIVELSAQKITWLAIEIFPPERRTRILKKEVIKLLSQSMSSGYIDPLRTKESLRSKILGAS